MDSEPLVSVIITTYNRATLVTEAITSVLRQDYTNYEVIVADDGSTDDTSTRLEAADLPIRYLRLQHSGRPEDARNAAIPFARGELIAFLDDDDVWRPGKLTLQVDAFARHDHLGLAYTDAQLLYADGSLSEPVLKPSQRRPDAVFDQLISGCFIYPSTVVVHRRLFHELGLFRSRFPSQSDYDFWLRAAHVAPAAAVPHPLVLIRRHEDNLAAQYGLSSYDNAILVLEELPKSVALTLPQRVLRRRALARHYAHVGLARCHSGQVTRGRQQLVHSLLLNPLVRRPWAGLLRTVFPVRRR